MKQNWHRRKRGRRKGRRYQQGSNSYHQGGSVHHQGVIATNKGGKRYQRRSRPLFQRRGFQKWAKYLLVSIGVVLAALLIMYLFLPGALFRAAWLWYSLFG